jgi:DNA-binding protein H-NS
MDTYQAYMDQIADIQLLADVVLEKERVVAREKIVAIMRETGMSMSDLFDSRKNKDGTPRKKYTAAAVKYADGKGNSWTGQGRTPKWIASQDRQQFLVSNAT